MKQRFRLLSAPLGKARASFFGADGCTPVQVELTDQVYVLDGKDSTARNAMAELLLKRGFVEAGALPDDKELPPGARGDEPLPEPIRLMHPDATPNHQINATVKVRVGKEFEQVQIEAGFVQTDKPALIRALLKKGYINQDPDILEKYGPGSPASVPSPKASPEPSAPDPDGDPGGAGDGS